MANLPPARTADAAGFADGEVREVVVQDEFLLGGAAGVGVELLGVFAGAQRAERDGLRLPALEQRRAVRPRQEAHFADDGADGFEIAPVEPLALVHDQAADRFLLDVVEGVLEHELGHLLLAELLDELLADLFRDGRDGAFAVELARREQGRDDAVARQRLGFLEDLVGNDVERDLAFGLAGAGDQFLLRGNRRLNRFLAELKRGVEVRVGDFLGGAFVHHHVRLVADIDQVQVAFEHLGVGGVGDELAADAPDPGRADRAGPRDVAEHQRRRGADQRQHIRVVLAIGAQHDALDLDFVIPALGKERPDGPVNEPAGEDFLLGGAAFAFEVAAGELAGRSRLFPVIHRQRKEFLALFGLGGGDGRHDDNGFAQLDAYGAVGLFGEFAGFNDELTCPRRGQ